MMSPSQHTPDQQVQPQKRLPGVKMIVAVASGKGGVGKSTVAVNLALAFVKLGKKTGLMDADIYGPSQHIMLGLRDFTPQMDENRKIQPLEKFGLKLMSFGFFVKPQEAVVWRGPMVGRMVQQFVDDVQWGDLDVLVVDLPPGTGDVQLTLTQILPLTGAVVVSTPQDVALADAVKGVNMFQKVNVSVVGIVENMSYFECPKCTHRTHIFSHAGARQKAEELSVPFLGEIPLEEATRYSSDQGKPVVVKEPDSPQAKRFVQVAEKVWQELENFARKKGPVFTSTLGGQKTVSKPQGFDV